MNTTAPTSTPDHAARCAAVALLVHAAAAPALMAQSYELLDSKPLKINVGQDASLQIYHDNYPGVGQVYPSGSPLGDSGVIMKVGANTYAPWFLAHGGGTRTGPLGFTLPWSPVASPPPTGVGGPGDPLTATVEATAALDSIDMKFSVSHVCGDEFIVQSIELTNNLTTAQSVDLYLASDFLLDTTIDGRPARNVSNYGVGAGSCAALGFNYLHIPYTPAQHDFAGAFGTLWADVAAPNLSDTIATGCMDAGSGLQWKRTIAPGATEIIRCATSLGTPPPTRYATAVLDVSTSMGTLRPATFNSRWLDAKNQLKKDIRTFFTEGATAGVSVWQFSDAFTNKVEELSAGFVGEAEALAAIDLARIPGSLPNLADALCTVSDYMETSHPALVQSQRHIFLATQGVEGASTGPCSGLPGTGTSCASYSAGSWRKQVCDSLSSDEVVHVTFWNSVVSVGPEVEFSKALAQSSTGSFLGVADADADYPMDYPPIDFYCDSSLNSSGQHGVMDYFGDNRLSEFTVLRARCLPINSVGIFIYGPEEGFSGLGPGYLCLQAPINRIQPALSTGPTGEMSHLLDTSGLSMLAGSTWHFQGWFRDVPGVPPHYNLTNGMRMTFVP